MGNVLAQPLKPSADLLGELPSNILVLRDTLGGGRFQKTLLCMHDEGGLVVVKVYQKRADTPPLEQIRAQLLRIRAALSGLPLCHVWPWQAWLDTPNMAYLIRQHLACSLYDRLSTRPFLSQIEKRWVAFQLLQALAQAHEAGVCHGDLKAENVLLTSWHWLFLVDWAPYKPLQLPEDNPADFSFYFDTGGRRRCYIAPERFYTTATSQSAAATQQPGAAQPSGGQPYPTATGSSAGNTGVGGGLVGTLSDGVGGLQTEGGASPRPVTGLTPAMDVFSAGCVMAELCLDGRALFDLGTLLGYKRHQWDPTTQGSLNGTEPGLRRVITHMIQLDPAARWTARQYLDEWQPALFPAYFSEVLHPFFDSLLPLDTDGRIAATSAALPAIKEAVRAAAEKEVAQQQHTGEGPHHVADGASAADVMTHEDHDGALRQTSNLSEGLGIMDADGFPVAGELPSPTLSSSPTQPHRQSTVAVQGEVQAVSGTRAGDGMVLVAVLLCSLLRGARLVESKRQAVQMLTDVSLECDEDVRLQCCVPWLVTLLGDSNASVRCLVLSCLVRVMASIQVIPPSDAKVFQDYLLPALSLLPHDQEEMVRCEYAAGIAHLAEAAHRHVMRLQQATNATALAAAAATAAMQGIQQADSTPTSPLRNTSTPGARQEPATPTAAGSQPSSSQGGAAAAGSTPVAAMSSSRRATAETGMNGMNGGSSAVKTAGREPDGDVALTQPSSDAAHIVSPAATPSRAVVAAAAVGLAEAAAFRAEAELSALRVSVEKVVLDLVTGMRSSAAVKRSLLANAGPLAVFYGRRELNNTLLPLIITCLNAQEWQLRSSFFQAVATIGPHTGRESLDVFLLPCLEQALADGEVSVVCDAVCCASAVAPHLRKRSLLQAARTIVGLTEHSSTAVRSAAIAFIASAARALPAADVVAQLSPLVSPHQLLHPLTLRNPALLADYLVTCSMGGGSDDEEEDSSGFNTKTDSIDDSDDDMQLMGTLSRPLTNTRTSPAYPQIRIGGALSAIPESESGAAAQSGHSSPAQTVTAAGNATAPGQLVRNKSGKAQGALGSQPLRRSGLRAGMRSLQHTAPARVNRLNHLGMSLGSRTAGASGMQSGLTSMANTQALHAHEIEYTAGGMVMHPTAPVYLLELPDTPAPIIQAAALTEAHDPNMIPPSANQSALGPSQGLGLQPGHGKQSSQQVASMTVFDEAVALLQPGTSLHRAAVASIRARVAALEAWVSATRERLSHEPGAAEAVDRQQLDRATALLTRLHGTLTQFDTRSPATLTTFKLAQLACRILPSPNAASRASGAGVPAPGGSRLQPPLGYTSTPADGFTTETADLANLTGLGVADAVTAAMSTKLGTQANPQTSPSLVASLANLTLSSLRSSLDPTHVLAAAGGLTAGGAPGSYTPSGGVGGGGGGDGAGGTVWKPKGVLVGHLMEHRRAISRIAVARNGNFAVTTSLDETAKVWDLRRLERDVAFHSRLTYAAHAGSLTSCAAVEDDASIATGSAAGTIHVWRVETSTGNALSGVVGRRQLAPHQGAVLDVGSWGPHALMYITQQGGVHAWDLRVKQDVWRLSAPPAQGLVEHMALEPVGPAGGACGWGGTGTWLLTGSSRGWVTVWDVRFMLPAHSWQHPMRCAMDAMALATAPPHRLGLLNTDISSKSGSQGNPAGPLLYVAAGHQEIALWDVATSRPVQVLRCIGPHELGSSNMASGSGNGGPATAPTTPLPGALQPALSTSTAWLNEPQRGSSTVDQSIPFPSHTDSAWGGTSTGRMTDASVSGRRSPDAVNPDGSVDVLGVARLAQPTPRPPGAGALLPLSSGLLLTGSTDRCIRCWDGGKADNSYLVAGPLWSAADSLADVQQGLAIPQYKYTYRSAQIQGVPVLEERCSLEVVARFTESSQEIRQMMRVHDQCHGDAITHMTSAEGLQGGRLLLTAARDGSFKAWK